MKLCYKDTVILVDPVTDAYGSEKIGRQETVKCLIGPARGYSQANQMAQIDADIIVYLDHQDSFVTEMYNRLEGMLIVTQFGEASTDAWYRIETINVGRANLLDNRTDNIQCNLKKTTPIGTVS